MDETVVKKTRANKKVVIGISGASGIIYGLRAVEVLKEYGYDQYVIITNAAIKVAEKENGIDLVHEVRKFTSNIFMENEIDAPTSSSSFTVTTKGMIIIPCSINTLAYIAHGFTSNLLTRSAINYLRSRQKLVLVIRETPLGQIELYNALKIAKAGGIIMPASPGFYIKPTKIQDLIDFIVGKALDLLGIRNELYKRWSKSDQDPSYQVS
ncbi:3-octaprenyl-4-hydroxybenzoate carboxy-lyase [Acidianus hospitalis W1]|jgi:4-hydroxy-3-polyprenylbenzoate decarboxylase|uniref:Flavin prenyltransferase UbiX n=1 Tax=Acidianus hospitalis (strain W1) TaxID=933801 RepID=F4B7H3_ACIHW|nr:UbiX family flavin prenyltransferase [Acidianus hospitalis]AEE93578.1 3-octaprenyl-4-hydroxybenzoate carboxy-lyase [Acidianus hospitalis W1]MDT7902055.1 UbiX family flavin prenyltransferase [Acidianus sp.]